MAPSLYSHHSSARATSGCSKSWSPGTKPELLLSNWNTESTQYELRIMGRGIYAPVAHALRWTPRLKNVFFGGTWQAWLDQEAPSHARSAPKWWTCFWGSTRARTQALLHCPCVNINMHEAGHTEAHGGCRTQRRVTSASRSNYCRESNGNINVIITSLH